VGSFLRYLAETHGPEKLRALYERGDFETAYGRSLDALATEWEKTVDATPLDEGQMAQAFARFRRTSLFKRPCAREVASLREEARAGSVGFRRRAEPVLPEPSVSTFLPAVENSSPMVVDVTRRPPSDFAAA
jgi:hypothetical protein